VLSLSTWREEKAVVRWRTQGEHHRIQEQGRNGVFSDYHLRLCEVIADTHPPEGLGVIEQHLDETETGDAKALAITEISPATNATFVAHAGLLPSFLGLDVKTEGLVDYDVFESIYDPGKMLVLSSWKTASDCTRWEPYSFAGVAELRYRRVRNIRDYGMFERKEAAQYYPDGRLNRSEAVKSKTTQTRYGIMVSLQAQDSRNISSWWRHTRSRSAGETTRRFIASDHRGHEQIYKQRGTLPAVVQRWIVDGHFDTFALFCGQSDFKGREEFLWTHPSRVRTV